MIVSGGLGCSKVPLRLGVPPEIVRVIRLGPILKTKTAPEGAVLNSLRKPLSGTDRRSRPPAD